SYWQKGLPKIETVYYPAFTSNDPANQQLASGKAQWGSQFIPNINKYYLSKSANNHYWFPPLVNVSIFINLKDPILSNVAVRKALAYAIDREKVSKIGEYGYEPASNQTGIVTPTFNDWLDQGLAKQVDYNPQKAENRESTTYGNDNDNGKFQLSYNGNESGGPTPYYEPRQLLYSKNSAPIGKPAASNWERYENPAVDKLIEDYGATTDPAKQHQI